MFHITWFFLIFHASIHIADLQTKHLCVDAWANNDQRPEKSKCYTFYYFLFRLQALSMQEYPGDKHCDNQVSCRKENKKNNTTPWDPTIRSLCFQIDLSLSKALRSYLFSDSLSFSKMSCFIFLELFIMMTKKFLPVVRVGSLCVLLLTKKVDRKDYKW